VMLRMMKLHNFSGNLEQSNKGEQLHGKDEHTQSRYLRYSPQAPKHHSRTKDRGA
jgi:hypothetical protein